MNIGILEQRQALTAWRDQAILAALGLVNTKAKQALQAFDAQMAQAGVIDTLWSRETFAATHIDATMGTALAGCVKELLCTSAKALEAIHPDYDSLATALARSDSEIVMPTTSTPDHPAEAPPKTEQPSPVHPAEASRLDTVRQWAAWAGSLAQEGIRAAGDTVWDKAGLYALLRHAALERLRTAWVGTTGDARPFLGQVISLIDNAANRARSTTL